MKVLTASERLTPEVAAPGVGLRVNQLVWRVNRMNILRRNKPSVQFRCRLVAGALVFEQRLPAAGGPGNYQEVSLMVVQTEWNDFYRKPETEHCESSTDDLPTSAVFPSKSSAGSLNQTGLSTFAKTTNMASASALLTSSSVISGK
ncbi:hypothetical protein Pat9b_5367 (plasmid) [Pantoea sp. At-9b]|nr:hypothetical protein Pat9b_5367 [Pantoea sp. At-9b]